MEFTTTIEGGKIQNPKTWRMRFSELPDGHYTIKVVRGKKRSGQQNRYYFGPVLELVFNGLRDMGHEHILTNDDAHKFLKNKFLRIDIVDKETGEILGNISRSTTALTTFEFSEYIERIAQFCAEYLGFELPMPNTQLNFFDGTC